MKTYLVIICLFMSSSLVAQTLKDSLFGGKLKADTSKTYVSKDTSKYIAPKIYHPDAAGQGETKKTGQGETKKNVIAKPDESMPDSLNQSFYSRQKAWKRFIDVNTSIVTQEAAETKKVRKGQYNIEIDYEIGLNGKVTTKNITCNPANEYLTEQVTEFMKRPPTLSPPVYSDGPRTLQAVQSITIVKK